MEQQSSNQYLDEVQQRQAQVGQELKRRRTKAAPPASPVGTISPVADPTVRAVDYRITGFWRWKTVLVPPNVYVVHTRRGHKKPLHIGLGESFGFNPFTDSFLVVPAAMQTIIINANCICRERQGILVQAYVQWIIDDIETAYRKLDFSDPEDPMRIVNVQLREQAEAAIKDKVSTMGIDDVLTDKQPIIEELTHRLRVLAKGSSEDGSSGLGLKIVTIQIKEAVVSSTRLWENLQAPFRAERHKDARMAQLENERVIAARELAVQQERSTEEIESEDALQRLRSDKEQVRFDRDIDERRRRHRLEQEAEQQAIDERNATEQADRDAQMALVLKDLALALQRTEPAIERAKAQALVNAADAEGARAKATFDAEIAEITDQASATRQQRELAIARVRMEVENLVSDAQIRAQLIERLPEIAESLPAPDSFRAVTVGDSAGSAAPLLSFLTTVLGLTEQDATAS